MNRQWRGRVFALFLLILLSSATLLPTILGLMAPGAALPSWYTSFFKNRMILGLDLQGGIHLQYSVDTREALKNKSRNLAGRLRDELKTGDAISALKGAEIKVIPYAEEITQLTVRFEGAKADEHAQAFADGVVSFLQRSYPEYKLISQDLSAREVVIGMSATAVAQFQEEYGVDTREALKNKNRNLAGRLRDELKTGDAISALKDADIKVIPAAEGGVEEITQLTVRFEGAKAAEHAQAFADGVVSFLQRFYPEYQWISQDLSAREVVIGMSATAVAQFQEDALAQAIETIERRINGFGVAESSVSRRDADKIVVELPGLSEEEFGKAKEKLSQTGLLYFNIVEYDDAKSSAFFQAVGARAPQAGAWPEELKGAEEHKVYVSGGVVRSTSRDVLSYMVGEALKADTDHLVGFEKIFVDPQDADLTPITRLSAQQEKQIEREAVYNPSASVVVGYQVYYLRALDGLSGENVEDAQVGYDSFQRPVTNMTFGSQDADRFADLTEKNVNRQLAIRIDDIVYSAPNINERIGGGRVQISMGSGGASVMKEAQALAMVLKSGALQAPLRQIYSTQVGPTLGQESIEAGRRSIVVGFLLVMVFMIAYYGRRGVVANVALLLNVLFLLSGLALFGATLTMPGIAGIVLTVGMAVDANVLIFERMKEEERRSKKASEAFAAGYEKAWTAILDSNITTGIAAVVLYQFGTGPVKGFAVTLGLGILSSMYTAIVVTRLIFEYTNARSSSGAARLSA